MIGTQLNKNIPVDVQVNKISFRSCNTVVMGKGIRKALRHVPITHIDHCIYRLITDFIRSTR